MISIQCFFTIDDCDHKDGNTFTVAVCHLEKFLWENQHKRLKVLRWEFQTVDS